MGMLHLHVRLWRQVGKGEQHALRLCVSDSHGRSCRKLSKALTVTIVLFLVEGN